MLIGLDFDNTIVNYNNAIKRLALARFKLPVNLTVNKISLRNFLRSQGREQEWTEFQGELYGPGMRFAAPYKGAIEAMHTLTAAGHNLVIISHRTRIPYAGHPYDLHASANHWIRKNLASVSSFSNGTNYFLETQIQKINKIRELGCAAFVDDLPELFDSESFPQNTTKILFTSETPSVNTRHMITISTWQSLPKVIRNNKHKQYT
jgi:hypothetical protein